jgi:molybdopterin-guanine dinucleotide biosynthesis protein A
MGSDKALLDFDGQTLVEHLLARLDGVAVETIITTNHPERYNFLKLPLVPDVVPGRGALGGIYTALQAATQPLVAVVACDMPFASPAILRTCRDILADDPNLDVVIPSTEYGLEPLHAVYRRATCLPAVKAAIDSDQWKVISWHGDVNVRVLLPAEIAQLDPDGSAFVNVNTPQELKAAIRRARQSTDG